jgi:hypothetical protein
VSCVPPQLLFGVTLVAVAWPLAWSGEAPYSEHTFFPLWFGYILAADGVVRLRTGTSLLTRSRARFALLFVYSLPLWWLFEVANEFIDNWRYVVPRDYGPVAYAALASLSFSTVMPAVFETAELYRSVPLFRRPIRWLRIAPTRPWLIVITLAGATTFLLALAAPRHAFPLVWLGVFFALDPLNALTGGRSLASQVARGRWDTVFVLFAAGITCGFFWELWNVRSMPKWVYDVPYVGSPRLFEMPLLGYGGYLPFALEVYAVYRVLDRLTGWSGADYLTFDQAPTSAR